MADVIDYKIHGDNIQIVEVELDPGEAVRAEVRNNAIYGRWNRNGDQYGWRNVQSL